MRKLTRFFKWFFYITTCVVLICAANVQISGGNTIPAKMLWQILLSGFVTSLVTMVFLPDIKDNWRLGVLKYVAHFVSLCVVMILCGCWFGWMDFNPSGIVMMVLSVAIVYFLVFLAAYLLDRKQADEINQKLKKKYRDKE